MNEIQLPARVNGRRLLLFLAQLDRLEDSEGMRLDFSALRKITPVGLVTLAACVQAWRRRERKVEFYGLERCAILGYLQRMDLLRVCGVDSPERFVRHESQGRFVPLEIIEHPVDQMGYRMASCLAPGGEDYDHPLAGIYDLAWYVFTEVANNIRQHSGGIGYASAQVNRREGLVRMAVADNGVGIRGSLQLAGLPLIDSLDDAAAIRLALEPRVSCKSGEPNEGVGLTLVSEMAQLVGAWLLIVSGTGYLQISAGAKPILGVLPNSAPFPGTVFAMTFPQQSAKDFPGLLHEAKIRAGLLRTGRALRTFQP